MYTDNNGHATFTVQLGPKSDVGAYDTEIEIAKDSLSIQFSTNKPPGDIEKGSILTAISFGLTLLFLHARLQIRIIHVRSIRTILCIKILVTSEFNKICFKVYSKISN